MTNNDLHDGVAVIIGGAGLQSGLGTGLVQRTFEEGMRVAIVDLDGAAAEAVASRLRGEGAEAIGIQADVTDLSSLQSAAEQVAATFGSCNLLFANVGGGAFNRVDEYPLAAWRREIDIMVLGTIATMQAFLPVMRTTPGKRRIVITASVAAIAPGRYQGPYRASKAAVTSIAETINLELGPEGIGATVAFPSGMAQGEQLDAARAMLTNLDHDDVPDAGLNELQFAVGREMSHVPADLATGYQAAGSIIDAVKNDKLYVVTHGLTAVETARDRNRQLEAAFVENDARNGLSFDPAVAES